MKTLWAGSILQMLGIIALCTALFLDVQHDSWVILTVVEAIVNGGLYVLFFLTAAALQRLVLVAILRCNYDQTPSPGWHDICRRIFWFCFAEHHGRRGSGLQYRHGGVSGESD